MIKEKKEIKKGETYLCIKDYVMDNENIDYSEGYIYISEKDGCLTDNENIIEHWMDVESDFHEHFKLVEDTFGIKDNEDKVSLAEIDPAFIKAMAERMSRNKDKYPVNNWKKYISPYDLIDAMERHLADLKLLIQEENPIYNTDEEERDHLAALGCNAMMLNYFLEKDA